MPRADPRSRRRALAAHRTLGIVASGIVMILVVTGIMLNHADELKLVERPIRSELLLDWYDMTPDGAVKSFRAGEGWIVSLERDIYWNATLVASSDSPLVGAVTHEDFLVVASADSILLLSNERRAKVLDRLDSASLPGSLDRIGTSVSGELHAEVAGRVFRANPQLLSWSPEASPASIVWSEASVLPPAQRKAVLESYRGDGLSQFRLVSDLHSGRILGTTGGILVDGAALVLLFLTGSGIYNWARSRKPASDPVLQSQPKDDDSSAPGTTVVTPAPSSDSP